MSGVAGAAEAGEDLAPDRIVPVAERRADGRRVGGPGPAPEHLVVGAEEHRRVLPVREPLVAGVGQEVRGGPLPYVPDHLDAAPGARALRVRTHRGGAEVALAEVGALGGRVGVAPGVAPLGRL